MVRFYNQGGREYLSGATSPEIRPLGLSDREIGDIVTFLRALTAPVEFEIPKIRFDLGWRDYGAFDENDLGPVLMKKYG